MAELKTIGDLIDHLAKFPRETRIVTRGFDEAGYVDFSYFEEVRIVPEETHCYEYDDAGRGKLETGAFDALLMN
jgi:hypothetical protein